MSLQIANPAVVAKVERLAKATGMSKTALVDRAVDQLQRTLERPLAPGRRLQSLLNQIDAIPERADASDPLGWDENGLPT
jgi:antitoxin VapB